jgi:hypothetical protein
LGAVLALDCFAGADVTAFAGDFTAFTAIVVTLPEGLVTGVFFGTDRVATGVDLLAGLAAGLVLVDLAEGVGVFAVFFIAFAIESTAK